jgi:sulfatase modifying factor 1
MGCAEPPYPGDGEGPVREVTLSPFAVAATAVTNAEFAEPVRPRGSTPRGVGWNGSRTPGATN